MSVNPDCHRVTLMWGAQTAKTMTLLCAMGYHIDLKPQSQMLMQPSQGDLNTWKETKFNPMISETPSLASKVAKPRAREGVNNQQLLSYPGGFLMFSWSGSPKTMRQRSAPKIYADEIDGYERTAEGDPVSLLEQRAATFGSDRMLMEASTPTIKNFSMIEKSYDVGDQRRRYVPCPHCQAMQTLNWANVQWDKDEDDRGKVIEHYPATAIYVCGECGVPLSDGERLQMLQGGEWRAKKPFKGHASYHLSELYSTFRSLQDIVQSFLDKKAKGDLQTFINVSLAETWEEEGTKVEPNLLWNRRRKFPARVPAEYCVLTAAIDIQDDRVEIGVEAWGEGERNAKIDLIILYGDLSTEKFWAETLAPKLDKLYTHENGAKLNIACVTIDTGGHFTDAVYKFVKPREKNRVWGIKGRSGTGHPVITRPGRRDANSGKIRLWPIGTDTAKELIYKRYEIAQPGPGYIDFPILECFDNEYFEQLTAEQKVTYYRKGFPYSEWRARRVRNEGLDLAVYNLAALYILNPDYSKLSALLAPDEEPEAPEPVPDLERVTGTRPAAKRRSRGRKTKGYVNKW